MDKVQRILKEQLGSLLFQNALLLAELEQQKEQLATVVSELEKLKGKDA